MLPPDRVMQLGQWLTTIETDESQHTPWVRIALASFPGTLAFRLSPADAQALAETLLAISKHQIAAGEVGPLTIHETDYHTPPRTRVLELRFAGPFPGECAMLLTDIVARRLAFDLVNAVQQLQGQTSA
jgi:hypothetical protein